MTASIKVGDRLPSLQLPPVDRATLASELVYRLQDANYVNGSVPRDDRVLDLIVLYVPAAVLKALALI